MEPNGVGESGFSQTHNIGNNANIGIRGFTMWKQKNPVTKCYPSEYWTQASNEPLIPNPMLSFLDLLGMCYLGDL